MIKYIDNVSLGTLFLIKFDDDVKKIKEINIRSKEEFELESILFLDTYKRASDVDKIFYSKNEEIIFTYNNRQEIFNKIK